MKKILSITLAALMLSLCFIVSVSAAPQPEEEVKYATFSEDFTVMFLEGKPYSRVNLENIYVYEEPVDGEFYDKYSTNCSYIQPYGYEVKLSEKQTESVNKINVYPHDSYNAVCQVEIYYKDGALLTVSFLENIYLKEYNKLINHEYDEFFVNFNWPADNIIPLTKDVLSSQATTEFEYWQYDESFTVEGGITDGKLRYTFGEIRYIEDDFYYYNPELNKNIEAYFTSDAYLYEDYSYSYETEPKVVLNKITDEATISALEAGLKNYYEDDMGYIYNDELLEGVSKVFLTILFGIIPFGALITFVVFTIKSKKKTYRKIYITGCIVSLAEIATFIGAAIYLFK